MWVLVFIEHDRPSQFWDGQNWRTEYPEAKLFEGFAKVQKERIAFSCTIFSDQAPPQIIAVRDYGMANEKRVWLMGDPNLQRCGHD